MKKHYFNYVTYINIIRWWLTGFLIFIPFQHLIVNNIKLWNDQVALFIRRLDDMTIIILFPIAIIELYKNKEIFNSLYLVLLFPIFFLNIVGLSSGVINGNSLLITFLGTYDYIKTLLVIFIFAAFIREIREFKKIFRLLLIVVVFIGLVAFVQEFWAIFSRYIRKEDLAGIAWRIGIYRVSSLMPHYNFLGLYCLLVLTSYLFIAKKVNFFIIFSLLTGILVSVSRTIYTGFVILSVIQIFKGRRWLILFLIPIVISLFFMSSLDDFDISKLIEEKYNEENMRSYNSNPVSYRNFARYKAMTVWKDHPLWGVGPGMFGGAVATKYRSYVYEEYSFLFILNWFKTLDQLWPQLMAEMGIIGTVVLAVIFVSLLAVFFISRHLANSDEIRGLFTGLSVFTIIFFIYTFSGSLNIVPVLFTYSALAGMALGCETHSNH